MQQAIIGFHLDDEQHEIAELDCGHNQHIRCITPWRNCPWVITEDARKTKLGRILNCKVALNSKDLSKELFL